MKLHNIYLIFTITVVLFIAGCKGTTGPAGPSINGSVSGFVTLVQTNGTTLANPSGATVAIQGTSLSTTTDSIGKWTISGLTTGTYTVNYSMSGYGSSELADFQFTGGDTDFLAKVTLAQPPNFTVALDTVKSVPDSNSLFVFFTTSVPQKMGDTRVLVAVGTSPDVSASNPNDYLYSVIYTSTNASLSEHIYESDLEYAGFTSGMTVYVVAYPLAYGDAANEYSSYVDHNTGRTVYTSLGATSQVIPLVVP
jgi:hypothetical protein